MTPLEREVKIYFRILALKRLAAETTREVQRLFAALANDPNACEKIRQAVREQRGRCEPNMLRDATCVGR